MSVTEGNGQHYKSCHCESTPFWLENATHAVFSMMSLTCIIIWQFLILFKLFQLFKTWKDFSYIVNYDYTCIHTLHASSKLNQIHEFTWGTCEAHNFIFAFAHVSKSMNSFPLNGKLNRKQLFVSSNNFMFCILVSLAYFKPHLQF